MTAVKTKLFVFLQFKNTEKSSQYVKYPTNYKYNSTENKRHKKLIKTNKIGVSVHFQHSVIFISFSCMYLSQKMKKKKIK